METRPFTPNDRAGLEAFLARIPKGESTFFKEDIDAPGTVDRWVENANGAHRTLAWDGDTVVGYAAVIPGVAHMLNMEAPETFNRLVLDFLGRSS